MLKLSTKARYALRAAMELALREGQGPIQLHEIARAQRLSPKYLEQLAISLRQAGLIKSERGPRGGYELVRPAHKITALEVVQAVEGQSHLEQDKDRDAPSISAGERVARDLWQRVNQAINETLEKTTLAEICEEQRAAEACEKFCYQI